MIIKLFRHWTRPARPGPMDSSPGHQHSLKDLEYRLSVRIEGHINPLPAHKAKRERRPLPVQPGDSDDTESILRPLEGTGFLQEAFDIHF